MDENSQDTFLDVFLYFFGALRGKSLIDSTLPVLRMVFQIILHFLHHFLPMDLNPWCQKIASWKPLDASPPNHDNIATIYDF